jgi:hypothetical protein
MISFLPRPFLTLAAFSAIALAASYSAACAQQAPREQGRDLLNGGDEERALAAPLDGLILYRRDPDETRRRLDSRLKSRVEQIDRACALSKEQRNKLLVAGRGDIKRSLARLDELKNQFAAAPDDGRKQREILAEIASFSLSTTDKDIFGANSLFSKILKNTLTPAQLAAQQKAKKDAGVAQHRTTVGWVVRSVDTWLQLRPEQHQKLEDLLIAETRPPQKWGEYDYYGVMCQAAKLSEKKLKPIFDDEQWVQIRKQLDEALRIEKTLRIEGFLPDEDVADAGKTRRTDPLPEREEPRC